MSAVDDALDDARLALARTRHRPIHASPDEDVDAIQSAWGVTAPQSYRRLMQELGGGTLQGTNVMELHPSRELLALLREDYRVFRSTPGARFAFFATDGGGWQYFFDVDDWFGRGAYAVLAAEPASGDVEFVAASFGDAITRVVSGTRRGPERDGIATRAPQGAWNHGDD